LGNVHYQTGLFCTYQAGGGQEGSEQKKYWKLAKRHFRKAVDCFDDGIGSAMGLLSKEELKKAMKH
jgi:hypothetical protein